MRERIFFWSLFLIAGPLLIYIAGTAPAQPRWHYRDVLIAPHTEPHTLFRQLGGQTFQERRDHMIWRWDGIMFVDSPPPERIMLHERARDDGAIEERLTIHHWRQNIIYQVCWLDGELAPCGYFAEAWDEDFGWTELDPPTDLSLTR